MDSSTPPERPRARSDVVFRQLDHDWVVYDPRNDRMHAMNLSAALVWSLCTGERDTGEIARAVGESFAPPRSAREILPDVEASIARFRSEGLLE